jgi:hypothetical protein
MDEDDIPELKTPEAIAGFLALKHANGMSFKQVLDIHTLILTRIGRDYVKTWGPIAIDGVKPPVEHVRMYDFLTQGAYYALNHLEDNDEWYDFGPKDDLTDWD